MSLLSKLIDIIYPPRCHICKNFLNGGHSAREPDSFCYTCLSDFKLIKSPFCPVCRTPFVSETQDNHLCEECLRKRPYYDKIYALYLYEGAIMKAIYRYKFGAKTFLSESLGPVLATFAEGMVKVSDNLIIIPVPLHQKRLRERGFNQSLILARYVAKKLDSQLDFLSLRRVRYTLPQTGLGKEQRRKNVRGAFQIRNAEAVKGKLVLLIDDVATTGNTLNECARVLRKAGCENVFCVVLARTGF